MAIPKTFKVKSKNLQYRSGKALKRKWMKRKKRITTEGKRVQEAEKELAENSLLDASSVEELDQRRRVHDNYKSTLREFYYSKASIKRKRRVELLKRKTYGTVCSNERRYVSGGVNKESHPLLFVGDRGYGVGSAIKGHLKYGGQWKPRKHSLYTSVCITNEHNTSQTCTYCFGKLTHPIRRIEENGKLYLKSVNGAVVRNNKNCLLSKKSSTHKGRDANVPVNLLLVKVFVVVVELVRDKYKLLCRRKQNNDANIYII